MKVIILAGGWGTRLGSLSEDIPKPMVKIGNKPIIWHIMKIFSHHNINDFIVSCGVKSNVIKDYFSNFHIYNNDFTVNTSTKDYQVHESSTKDSWNVTVADTGLNTLKGARIKRIQKYLDDGLNMVTYGDGLADIDIDSLISFHKSHGKMVTITGVRPPARFGEIIEEGGVVTSFKEKPQVSQGLINGGFMVFNKELLDFLSEDVSCDFEIGALEELSNQRQVMVYKHLGNWDCIDHERDVNHLNKLWENNKAFWKLWK